MRGYLSDRAKLREFKNDKLLLSILPDDQVGKLGTWQLITIIIRTILL